MAVVEVRRSNLTPLSAKTLASAKLGVKPDNKPTELTPPALRVATALTTAAIWLWLDTTTVALANDTSVSANNCLASAKVRYTLLKVDSAIVASLGLGPRVKSKPLESSVTNSRASA